MGPGWTDLRGLSTDGVVGYCWVILEAQNSYPYLSGVVDSDHSRQQSLMGSWPDLNERGFCTNGEIDVARTG